MRDEDSRELVDISSRGGIRQVGFHQIQSHGFLSSKRNGRGFYK